MDVTNIDYSAGRANLATGTFTADGTVASVKLGFRPRWIKVINITDLATHEKHAGMADGVSLRTVAAGTQTSQASTVTITEDGFEIAAAVAVDEKVIHWIAMT